MYAEISAAFASVNALTTLLKSAHSLGNYNEISAAVSKVNSQLLEAQSAALSSNEKQAALTSRVDALEKELIKLKDWETEARDYEATEVARGLFAYVHKGNVQPMSSTQKLCSNCFHQQRKSFLQESREAHREHSLTCHRCDKKVIFIEYKDCS